MGSNDTGIQELDSTSVQQEAIPLTKPSSSKRFFFVFAYMTGIPVFLMILILFALFLRQANTTNNKGALAFNTTNPKYQAVPQENESSAVTLTAADARVSSLEDFFERYEMIKLKNLFLEAGRGLEIKGNLREHPLAELLIESNGNVMAPSLRHPR